MTADQMPEDAEPASALRRYAPMMIILAALGLFFGLGGQQYVSFEALREHRQTLSDLARAWPVLAPLGLTLIYALLVSISFPGAGYLTIFSGFMFGLWVGALAAWAGAVIGATLIFLAARTAFGDVLEKKAGPLLAKFRDGFQGENAFNYLFALRLAPVFPFWLLNIAPAFVGMKLRTYTLATALGIIPGTFVYTWIGAGAGAVLDRGENLSFDIVTQPIILGPVLGLIALSLLPTLIKRLKAR